MKPQIHVHVHNSKTKDDNLTQVELSDLKADIIAIERRIARLKTKNAKPRVEKALQIVEVKLSELRAIIHNAM